jgi:serine phosphatase RsbU (regulator of sigma subunit)
MIAGILTGAFGLATAALLAALVLLWREWRRTATLQQVGLQLNSTIKRDELLRIIMETTAETMRAEGSSVILADEERGDLYFQVATGERNDEVREIRLKKGEGIAGWVFEHRTPVRIADATRDPRWSSRVADRVNIPTRSMLCVPVISNGKILGVLQVINKKGGGRFSRRDLRLLEMIASPAAVALENMMLYEALIRTMEEVRVTTAAKERMESELKIAQDIQRSWLPGESLRTDRIELHAELVPARVVGGDFYHFIRLDEYKLLFCLGDVSDKGMPAALFMSGLMIWIQAKADADRPPSRILSDINAEICRTDSAMFATIFLAVIDVRTGTLRYVDGGHCPPLIAGPDGVRKLPTVKKLPIGVFGDEEYEEMEYTLKPGEFIVLYTDGITEAENAQGEFYSSNRLAAAIESAGSGRPADVAGRVLDDVFAFAAGHPQSDDIAVMVLKHQERPFWIDK